VARYTLRVNGRSHAVEAEPGDSLLLILREDLSLTGAKYGCGEGECGACTVLVDGQAKRSCVTAIESAAEHQITTIEGLADGARLHAVQQAFVEVEAFQCGYCTAGMVMAAVGLLRAMPKPTEADIARRLDRNLCRCGTYHRIVRAVQLAASRMSAPTPSGSR
jgi:aerobic-type carbon monoxide dehydrogenase small subunit (CoxS/CutS family)